MNDVKKTIEKIVLRSQDKGVKQLSNGTCLIGRAPEIGSGAWYHLLFAPLTKEQIHELESDLHQELPKQIERFFGIYNGISLFGNELNIWGKRFSLARTGDAIWQPFDIVSHNRPSERPRNSPHNVVYFGSIDRGDTRVFFNPENGSVAQTGRHYYDPENSWPDFESWLSEELAFLNSRDNEQR